MLFPIEIWSMILRNAALFDLLNLQTVCWALKNLVDCELRNRIPLLRSALKDSLIDSFMVVHRHPSIVRRLENASELCQNDTHMWAFRENSTGAFLFPSEPEKPAAAAMFRGPNYVEEDNRTKDRRVPAMVLGSPSEIDFLHLFIPESHVHRPGGDISWFYFRYETRKLRVHICPNPGCYNPHVPLDLSHLRLSHEAIVDGSTVERLMDGDFDLGEISSLHARGVPLRPRHWGVVRFDFEWEVDRRRGWMGCRCQPPGQVALYGISVRPKDKVPWDWPDRGFEIQLDYTCHSEVDFDPLSLARARSNWSDPTDFDQETY
jgi:hypothetical protein